MASAVEEPKPSSSQENVVVSLEDINKLMLSGKKLYANKDFNAACEKFEDACSKLATKFGQTSNECGEAYFYYGKTLLDIARLETDVLGNVPSKDAAAKKSDGEKEEEKHAMSDNNEAAANSEEEDKIALSNDNEEEKSETAQQCKEDKTEKNAEETAGSCDEEDDGDNDDEEMQQDIQEETKESPAGESSDEEDAESDGDPDAKEDIGSMQLAWEMLELSRIIFARQESKEMKMKQAQANLALGEIGMELEHYPEAIGDFMECLRIQEQILDPDNRLLAETFYNLGLAYSFDRHYGKAIEYYSKAVSVIKLRIHNIKKQVDAGDSSQATELTELEELIPDISAKVEDAEYMKKSTEEIIKTAENIAKEYLVEESTGGFDEPLTTEDNNSSEAKVTDIGHLVRKKRKTNEEEEELPKRQRTDEQVEQVKDKE